MSKSRNSFANFGNVKNLRNRILSLAQIEVQNEPVRFMSTIKRKDMKTCFANSGSAEWLVNVCLSKQIHGLRKFVVED